MNIYSNLYFIGIIKKYFRRIIQETMKYGNYDYHNYV